MRSHIDPGVCASCGAPLSNQVPEGICPSCMLQGALELGHSIHDPSSTPASLPQLGDYQLLAEIARGGMGVVYRARQISLDRTVAVKLILIGHFADKAVIKRFKAEAAAAAKLRHPYIVAIHEIGEENGRHFFSMEYIEGPNLAEFIRQEPLTIRHSAQLIAKIAAAIQYAHDQGIIHRDLKPSNILIDSLLEPHITDFGLARDLQSDSELTLTGQVLGSPNYIAPEQASGQLSAISGDIYSLGAILYHLLTGRPPFAAETLTATLQQVTNADPVPPRILNPSVPRDLETICLKCLEKEPEKRFATADALAAELHRFLNNQPIHSRPITPPAKAWRWCRRNPVVAGFAAALMVALLGGFVGILSQWRRAEIKAEENRRNLYAADMILAQVALKEGNIGRAKEILEAYLPPPGQTDLRGWEWRYTWNQCKSDELFTLDGHSRIVGSLALSPDGRLASGGHDGAVKIWNLEKRELITNIFQGHLIRGLAFVKQGRELIAAASDGRVGFWNTKTWAQLSVITNALSNPDIDIIQSMAVSPDERHLAVIAPFSVTLWSLDQRKEIGKFPRDGRGGERALHAGIAFSPDSTILAFSQSQNEGAISLADVWKRTIIGELKGHDRFVQALAFSPDGSFLVSAGWDLTARVWHLASRKERKLLGRFPGWLGCVSFSPNGKLVAVAGSDQRVALFNTQTWEQVTVLKGHGDEIWSLLFSADGITLITSGKDRTIKCWSIRQSAEPEMVRFSEDTDIRWWAGTEALYLSDTSGNQSFLNLPGLEQRPFPLPLQNPVVWTLSPKCKYWADVLKDGTVRVYDLKRKLLVSKVASSSPPSLLQFSFDGSLLAGVWRDGSWKLWKMPDLKEQVNLFAPSDSIGVEALTAATPLSVEFSRSGRLIAIGKASGIAEVWNLSGKKLATFRRPHDSNMNNVTFSIDEQLLATAASDGKVCVWHIGQQRLIKVLGGQLNAWSSLGFLPDGQRLAAVGADGFLKIWYTESFREVFSMKLHDYALYGLDFLTDRDNTIAVLGDQALFLLRAPEK